VKKLAIFKVDIVYYTAMYEGLKDALHSDQSIVALNSFTPDQMDFRSSVSKLKELDVDAVGVYLIPGQIAQLYRQLAEQSELHPTFGTEDLGTKSEIEKFPRLMEGAVFARNPVVTSFAESYGKRYGNDIHIGHAAHAYDMAVFLTQMPKSGTAEQFMQTFRTAPVQSGPLGMPERSSVLQGGVSFTSPVALGIIKNGAVVAIR
jgi:ABC-type branched-subunit amino acid transport system substrate-binding protein